MDPQDKTVPWSTTDVPATWAKLEVPVVDPAHYELRGEVARGGVGRIIEAFDTRLQREVALKMLLRGGSEQPRFIREAMVTARLQHPAIIPIHEVGVFTTGEPFIAMKLVRGESLRDAIRKRPTFADRLELVSAVLSVAEAVAYAHSQRVIHRDLKPLNVLLGSFGEVVVIDWGLAKHLDAPDLAPAPSASATVDTTAVGAIVGTPAYMPPEQAMGRPVTERADVYSIGCILYEVLVGEAPHAGTSAEEVLHNVLNVRPAPVNQRVREVPADLAAIVTKAMMPHPNARYANAAELAAELRRFHLGQLLTGSAPAPDADAVIDAAFAEELNHRMAGAVKLFCIVGIVLISGFAWVPYKFHGGFDPRDLVPRSIDLFALCAVLGAAFTRRGRQWSQWLGVIALLVIGAMVTAVDVLEKDGLGWYTESMILIFLGCSALLPLTPRRTTVVLGILAVGTAPTLWAAGVPVASISFAARVWLVIAAAAVASVGSFVAHRLRRAEFYNRYRLQSANERLAKLERR